MAATNGGQIQDPDSLSYQIAGFYGTATTNEIVVDTTSSLIKLTQVGNLTRDGVTLKALYSKLKEMWRTDTILLSYPFPMAPITDEQYDFINGWNIDTRGTTLVASNNLGVLTVSTVTSGRIVPGQFIYANYPNSGVITGTYITAQLTQGPLSGGQNGRDGTYQLSDSSYGFVSTSMYTVYPNPTTSFSISQCNGSAGGYTISSNTSTFLGTGAYVTDGAYVAGPGIGPNARVAAGGVTSGQITLTVPHTYAVSNASLKFYVNSDLSYNLLRNGGYSIKDSTGTSYEEWMGAITLGDLGAQEQTIYLTTTAPTSNSNIITVADTSGIVVGSFVAGPGTLTGTKVASITSPTTFTLGDAEGNSRVVTIAAGAIISVKPKDQVYYQFGQGSSSTQVLPVNAVLHGAMDQPLQIYGDTNHGNFDYRTTATVKFYVREQGYTYSDSVPSDIGVTAFTYKTYRFSISNVSDSLYISHTDSQISSNGVTPDQSPYKNMKITWYNTPQPRVIGGSTYYFDVIIDADTTVPTTTGFSSTATAEQIYEFVQWSLRRGPGINIDSGKAKFVGTITNTNLTVSQINYGQLQVGDWISGTGVSAGTYITSTGTTLGSIGTYTVSISQTVPSQTLNAYNTTTTRVGTITRQLVKFISSTLYTIYDSSDGGVYIDHFKESDINRIVFSDNTNRQFPYVSFGQITFDSQFSNDGAGTTYRLYYNQINRPVPKGAFVASIAGTTMTVTKNIFGTIEVGDWLTGIATGTTVLSTGTIVGWNDATSKIAYTGTYVVSVSQSVATGTTITSYRGNSYNFGNSDAVLVKSYSSDPSGDGSYEVKGTLAGGLTQIIYDYDWDSNAQCTWQPYNRYFAGDEYRYNNGSTTAWYQVLVDYTSGATWSSADVNSNIIKQINGPTVVLVVIGTTASQYFTQIGTIQKSNTNLIAATSLAENNYVDYTYTNVSGTNIYGTGTGASFNVTVRAANNYSATVYSTGTNYAVGNIISILGTSVGITSTSSITLTVTGVGNATLGNITTVA